ncbi:MAG: sigma-54 dependent transcriptional regulator [FCB group bacterium]|nr:sigma-54 dependent transcriptional regulator [FCB group bacterium]
MAKRLASFLADTEVRVAWERSAASALERFESQDFAVIVLAGAVLKVEEFSVSDLLETLEARSAATRVVVLVDAEDISIAMSALRAGSYAYGRLPISDEELQMLVRTALAASAPPPAEDTTPRSRPLSRLDDLLGRSSAMQTLYAETRKAASSEIAVLLIGETGTGKDLVAQAIHKLSERRKEPYLPVHLGAVPPELVASELFGHEKGAFAGALERREGLFERANSGTVFLDEISTLDARTQVSLLRLLEKHEFTRLGGIEPLTTDARLIAATNEDLRQAIEAGRFREDLFYRLDVFRIVIPPLRERAGDIPLLVRAFANRFSDVYQRNVLEITPDFIKLLEAYPWPGNVRELKNVIQRAVLVCEGPALRPDHLPPRFRKQSDSMPKITFTLGTPLDDVEREMVVAALALSDNNRTRAAELLGISRRALYNKFRKHNLQ